MLRGYIDILISEIRGQRMPVPRTPNIHSRDPSIRQHELEYMLAPPESASSYRYVTLDDWAQGPVPYVTLDMSPWF